MGLWSDQISVFIRKDTKDSQSPSLFLRPPQTVHTSSHVSTYWDDDCLQAKRKGCRIKYLASPLNVDFLSSKTVWNAFLLCKSPCLWYFVKTAQAEYDSEYTSSVLTCKQSVEWMVWPICVKWWNQCTRWEGCTGRWRPAPLSIFLLLWFANCLCRLYWGATVDDCVLWAVLLPTGQFVICAVLIHWVLPSIC